MRTAKQPSAAKKQPLAGSSIQKLQPTTLGRKPIAASRIKVQQQQEQPLQARFRKVGSEGGSGDGPGKGRLVSLHFQDISLLHTDVKLLQNVRGGVNERLVAFYFAYLQSRRYKAQADVYFMQPALVKSIRQMDQRVLKRQMRESGLHEKKFILLPLCSQTGAFHVDHEHWSLLFIARPEGKIFYYDSLDNSHKNLVGALLHALRIPLALSEYSLVVGRCLQQAHDEEHQSGIHLMCMADHVADYVLRCGYASSSLLIARDDVQGMRTVVLQLIQCLGGILPPSPQQSGRYRKMTSRS